MSTAQIIADNMITSLGFSTDENIKEILNDTIGIKTHHDNTLSNFPVNLSLVNSNLLEERFTQILQHINRDLPVNSFTRLEKLFILSIHDALSRTDFNYRDKRVMLIISTTKGNIDLLEERYKAKFNHKRLFLWELGRVIRDFFGFFNPPLITSNACVSGLLAISIASRWIQNGLCDYAVVTGGDIISEFVVSGFHSFQALSPEPCKPYDINRNGLTLGEGCGTVILSRQEFTKERPLVRIAGSGTSNDANHISGPSRTGEELSYAINASMKEAGFSSRDIDYISTHGTATPFNDEMESKAIGLSKLNEAPLNSFKGYWGHTLGAAGIVESVAAINSLTRNTLFRSAGFEKLGVSEPLHVIEKNSSCELSTCLKTASGFGGCNAVVLFQKI